MKIWTPIPFILFNLIILVSAGMGHAEVDHQIYADLLLDHVKEGVVDYAGFKRDEARLDQYLKAEAATGTAPTISDEELERLQSLGYLQGVERTD